jgi:hypothetical protein
MVDFVVCYRGHMHEPIDLAFDVWQIDEGAKVLDSSYLAAVDFVLDRRII